MTPTSPNTFSHTWTMWITHPPPVLAPQIPPSPLTLTTSLDAKISILSVNLVIMASNVWKHKLLTCGNSPVLLSHTNQWQHAFYMTIYKRRTSVFTNIVFVINWTYFCLYCDLWAMLQHKVYIIYHVHICSVVQFAPPTTCKFLLIMIRYVDQHSMERMISLDMMSVVQSQSLQLSVENNLVKKTSCLV